MTDYLEAALLNHVFGGVPYVPPSTVYLAFYTDETDGTGAGTEVAGGSYARQPVSYAAAVLGVGSISNDAQVIFDNLPDCVIVSAAVVDALSSGHMLMQEILPLPRVVTAGDGIAIAPGDLTHIFQ
jgi:hypothetical protein